MGEKAASGTRMVASDVVARTTGLGSVTPLSASTEASPEKKTLSSARAKAEARAN